MGHRQSSVRGIRQTKKKRFIYNSTNRDNVSSDRRRLTVLSTNWKAHIQIVQVENKIPTTSNVKSRDGGGGGTTDFNNILYFTVTQ